jgi:1-acyl-sn-glycerol-3-phosphate acyltransferase
MILLRSLLFQIAFYAWTIILGVLYLPFLFLPGRWMMRCGSFWSAGTLQILAWTAGLTYEVRGREHLPDGPALIAMKHQSAWETFAVPVIFRRPAMVIKRELGWIPAYGWYALKAGMIPVDRSAGASALKKMVADAERALADGRPIVIFPEGTRTAIGVRRPYQPGVAALYRQLGVPLVPVAVNSGLFWTRRSWLRRPGRIVVDILPPIPPGRDRKSVMAALEESIETATARLVESTSTSDRPVDKVVDVRVPSIDGSRG